MKPRVTLRHALEDSALLGSALAGPTRQAWRSVLLAAMGEPLNADELETSPSSLVAPSRWIIASMSCGAALDAVAVSHANGGACCLFGWSLRL